MLKTDRDYEFAPIDSLNSTKNDYMIDVNDIIQVRFFTNNGLKVLDISSATEEERKRKSLILTIPCLMLFKAIP